MGSEVAFHGHSDTRRNRCGSHESFEFPVFPAIFKSCGWVPLGSQLPFLSIQAPDLIGFQVSMGWPRVMPRAQLSWRVYLELY